MNDLADLLIRVLVDFKALTQLGQLTVVGSVLIFLFTAFRFLWRWMKSRESRYVSEARKLKNDLTAVEKREAALEVERNKLAEHAPDTVRKCFEIERCDNNRRRLINLAQNYLAHHRDCSGEACRILVNHHLSRYEDGANALRLARTYAMGAIAAAPDDRDLAHLLDEIERLQHVEAAPPGTEQEIRDREERDRLRMLLHEAPGDVNALRAIGRKEFDAGRYRIAIVLWERAEDALLAGRSVGPNSPEHLSIRLDLGYATLFAGQLKAARDIIEPLPGLFARATKPEEPITLDARYLEAMLLRDEGADAEAERKLRDLLPIQEQVRSTEHPHTLNTCALLASVLLQLGRAQEAEGLLRDLPARQEKVRGAEYPDTLRTRGLLALAILAQGRAAEAETELRKLLTLMEDEKVLGEEHPDTLTARSTLASAILDQGRTPEAEAMFRDLLPLMEKVKGKEHPHTLKTRRALAQAALEQGASERARDALAPMREDGGDPETAMLRGWLADLDGDAAGAEALLDRAEAHLAHLDPEQSVRGKLARYRETRVPGGMGGTMTSRHMSHTGG